jgi:hypothetical protein
LADQEQGYIRQLDGEDWKLKEDDLPKGSTLSGGKALIDDYLDEETFPKKPKKNETCKGTNKGDNK